MVHVCGAYYLTSHDGGSAYAKENYLPQVELRSHTTILSTTSRTVLTQTFENPSSHKAVRSVKYTFPLYDGVAVVGFTCHVGTRFIKGVVKEKEKAREEFNEAVNRGETAGLFEQVHDASDVFTTTIGNVDPGAKIVTEITYLGELKHDAEVDGVRFTIPTIIAPRYGSFPTDLLRGASTSVSAEPSNGISITVDASMPDGCFIQKMQSPSHPIAISMGTTSTETTSEPSLTRASATLSLNTTELDKDFVLQVIAKNTVTPRALLETHPSIPHQRALMTTLVPKFALPSARPEIVFLCDRSGSMGGKMDMVVNALEVFLKSLPVGVKFNICSFGSRHEFLWQRSESYSQNTLDSAISYIRNANFDSNMGGTEILEPLQATIRNRYNDMPLEVMLLTDGEVWNQDKLFSYINWHVIRSKEPIRVFTLGIGHGASHALIEGIARAGNGFSQAVAEGEKLQNRVVRMLKGALSPHITDYSLELKYEDDKINDILDEEFELVEKVSDSLQVQLSFGGEKPKQDERPKKPISLFDDSMDLDVEEPQEPDKDGQGRYAHLPTISVPNILQAPHKIPSLFPFVRTNVYLLLSPSSPAATRTPTSVILHATSAHGPLELEIPVQAVGEGETIHQLAAKKAVQDLEEGRGWLADARCQTNRRLLRSKYEGRFEDMVEREAVRLGCEFQVGGKWCSFVAVEDNKKKEQETIKSSEEVEYLDEPVTETTTVPQTFGVPSGITGGAQLFGGVANTSLFGGVRGGHMQSRGGYRGVSRGGLFRHSTRATPASNALPELPQSSFSQPFAAASSQNTIQAYGQGPRMTSIRSQPTPGSGLFGSSTGGNSLVNASGPPQPVIVAGCFQNTRSASQGTNRTPAYSGLFGAVPMASSAAAPASPPRAKERGVTTLDSLISLQKFEGSWDWSPELFRLMGLSADEVNEAVFGGDKEAVATLCVVVFLRTRMPDEEETWELVVDKAWGWLAQRVGQEVVEREYQGVEGLVGRGGNRM